MTNTSICKIQTVVRPLFGGFRFLLVLLFFYAVMLAGCVSVAPRQQRLVSKPNMQFSGSAVFSYHDKLLSQIESGSASSIGGQSGSCGSCVAGGS